MRRKDISRVKRARWIVRIGGTKSWKPGQEDRFVSVLVYLVELYVWLDSWRDAKVVPVPIALKPTPG